MSVSFGISSLFGGAKAAGRKSKVAEILADASNLALPFMTAAAEDLKGWGEADWDRFKETYRPAAEAVVADAGRSPDYTRGDREVSVATAQKVKAGGDDIRRRATTSGGVASGDFKTATTGMTSAAARAKGVGGALSRLRAEQDVTDKQLSVVGLGRPDPAPSIAGLGIVTKGGSEYGKYSGLIGRDAVADVGTAAAGFGQAVGSYGTRSKTYRSPDRDRSGSPDYVWGNKSDADDFNEQDKLMGLDEKYADGGLIVGPGTGRSDSIPAVIDGQTPARVSNGEYHIPAVVVQRIGKDRLDKLISISRGK